MSISTENSKAIQRLTALWALSESGLGGLMFALKIPMTGFFLGAFALIIISMIAYFSNNNYRSIIQATMLVVMVKAIASPHSPPPAYLAVAFQGLTGALLFSTIRLRSVACVLLGILSMVESVSQKLIIMTLIFGKGIWTAVNELFEHVMKDFHLHIHMSYAAIVVCIYLLIYAVWGMLVGLWANKLPAKIIAGKEKTLELYSELSEQESITGSPASSKKYKRLFVFIAILLFIVVVFIWSGADSKMILQIVLRSIAAVLLLFFVLQPIVKYFFNKWLAKQSGTRKQAAQELEETLPQMRKLVSPAYRLAGINASGFQKLRHFIIYLIILALYGDK